METLWWIVVSGLLMSVIALVGSLTLVLPPALLERTTLPLVAFAAGSLIGGALLHMLPAGLAAHGGGPAFYLWLVAGFVAFFALEQLLYWRHCHRSPEDRRRPLTYLILLGDALHNFIGGLAVAGTFLVDVRLGVTTWLAAALHEIPQELGDFAVLVHGGWPKRRALLFNVLSALTFLVGGLTTWALSWQVSTEFLVPFAAGNFLYIGASDLVPEVNRHPDIRRGTVHFAAFVAGIALIGLFGTAG